ncbi:MAG: ATP-binding cassette domain-containing protein [Sphingomonas sp.]
MSFDVAVTRRFADRAVGASFAVGDGLTALFGPSGAGKTSVLNMVAGLLRPDAGHVRVAGETLFDPAARIAVPAHRRRAGYVFQEARLFPHLKVRANLLYGHRLAAPADRWMTPGEAIAFLGLEMLLDRLPATLSGGEARRVAIGRALLSGPRFLLMDEPLSSLDEARREEILRVIERIRDELKLPILYVTHESAEVRRLANQVVPIGSAGAAPA